jgi:hypothetical protein
MTSGQTLSGEGPQQTHLVAANTFNGPGIYVRARGRGPRIDQALVSGPGGAYRIQTDAYEFIDLRNADALDLPAHPTLSISMFVRLDAAPATSSGRYPFLTCGSRRLWAEGYRLTQELAVTPAGALRVEIAVSSGPIVVQSAAGVLPVGSARHVAVDYDGATLRVWCGVPGQRSTLVAVSDTVPARGGIVQNLEDTWTLGHMTQTAWETATLRAAPDITVDGLQIHTSKYAELFTCPATKPTPTSQTYFTLNFDDVRGDCIVGKTRRNVDVWMPLERVIPVAGEQIFSARVRELELVSNLGIRSKWAPMMRIENVGIHGGRAQLTLQHSFMSKVDSVQCSGTGRHRYGIALLGTSGICSLRDIGVACYGYGLIMGANSVVQNVFINGQQKAGVLIVGGDKDAGTSIYGVSVTDEFQAAPSEAAFMLSDLDTCEMFGCAVDFRTFDSPAIVADSRMREGTPKFTGTIALKTGGVAPVVKSLGASAQAIDLTGCVTKGRHPSS